MRRRAYFLLQVGDHVVGHHRVAERTHDVRRVCVSAALGDMNPIAGLDQLNGAIDRAMAWQQDLCNCGAQGEIQFELKSDARFLEELNHMLSSLFLYSGLPGDSIRQLTTAIREMGMNAIEWGHRKQINLLVSVTYRIDKDRVVIKIKDHGPGFNPTQVPHAADPEDPAKHMEIRDALGLRAGGFGILMARGLVDELQYNDTGNEVRLVKYFTPKKGA